MDTKEIVKNLTHLCQVDIDAVVAYDQSLAGITDPTIVQKFEQFKHDHERHINDLSNHIRKYGGQPPAHKPGVKGFVQKGFTAIRAAIGTEAVLNGMRTNESITNKAYNDALDLDWPNDVKQTVTGFCNDEERHLQYIEETLRERPWEQRPQA